MFGSKRAAEKTENAPNDDQMASTKIFGVSIGTVMKRPDHANEKVPNVIKFCCNTLYQSSKQFLKGIHTVGIFRESGMHDRIMYLKEIFDKGEIEKHASRNGTANPLDIEDPHVVASLLKLYLRELPEPLMKDENMDPILSVVKSTKGLEQDIVIILKIIKECVKQLTPLQLFVLRTLLRLLHETALLNSENKMRPSNLGIVFGQVIFRVSSESESFVKDLLANTTSLNKAAEIMIDHFSDIFSDPLSPEDLRYQETIFPYPVQFKAHLLVPEDEVEIKNELLGIEPPSIEENYTKFISSAPVYEQVIEEEQNKPTSGEAKSSRLSKLPPLSPKFLMSLEKSTRASLKMEKSASFEISKSMAASIANAAAERSSSITALEKPLLAPSIEKSSPEKPPSILPADKPLQHSQAPPSRVSNGKKEQDEDWVLSGDKEVEDIDDAMNDFYSLVIFMKRSGNKEMYDRLRKIYSVIHPAVYDTSNELNQPIPHKYLLSLNKQTHVGSQQQVEPKLVAEHLKFDRKIAAMRNALQQVLNEHF